MAVHPAHPGQVGSVVGLEADDKTVGDGVGLSLHAVGRQEPGDGFLHPVCFRPGELEPAAQVNGQIQ